MPSPRGMVGAATAMFCVGTLTAVSPQLHSYPVYGGQAVRYAAGALLLFLLIRLKGLPKVRLTRRDVLLVVALAATGLAAFNVFIVESTRHAEPATVGTIVATVPIVLALVVPLSNRQRPSPRVVTAAVVVAGGAGLTIGLGGATPLGVLLAIGALAGEVGFSLLAVPLLPKLGALRVSAYSAAAAVPLLLIAALLADPTEILRAPSATETVALGYLAVVVTAFAFYCWYDALPRLGADRAGLFSGFLPIGTIVGVLALGTGTVSGSDLLGVLVVVVGLLVGLYAPVRSSGREPDLSSPADRTDEAVPRRSD
ncbi:DMT family transporter [Actinophytocola sediminis]